MHDHFQTLVCVVVPMVHDITKFNQDSVAMFSPAFDSVHLLHRPLPLLTLVRLLGNHSVGSHLNVVIVSTTESRAKRRYC